MANSARIRSIVLVVILGVVWPFALYEMFARSGEVTVALYRAAYGVGLEESAGLVVRVVDAVVWAAVLGALFGIPLGLGVRRRVVPMWVAFLAVVLLVHVAEAVWAERGIGVVLLDWSIPEAWLHFLAVLAFAQWTTRLRKPSVVGYAIAP